MILYFVSSKSFSILLFCSFIVLIAADGGSTNKRSFRSRFIRITKEEGKCESKNQTYSDCHYSCFLQIFRYCVLSIYDNLVFNNFCLLQISARQKPKYAIKHPTSNVEVNVCHQSRFATELRNVMTKVTRNIAVRKTAVGQIGFFARTGNA
jgi:hypothetical protein